MAEGLDGPVHGTVLATLGLILRGLGLQFLVGGGQRNTVLSLAIQELIAD